MANEGIIVYRCNGIRIPYDPHKDYTFTTVKRDGRITITQTYPVDFKTFLEDLHLGLEKPNPEIKPVLKFLQQTGNEPTKELASQLLEQLLRKM